MLFCFLIIPFCLFCLFHCLIEEKALIKSKKRKEKFGGFEEIDYICNVFVKPLAKQLYYTNYERSSHFA